VRQRPYSARRIGAKKNAHPSEFLINNLYNESAREILMIDNL